MTSATLMIVTALLLCGCPHHPSPFKCNGDPRFPVGEFARPSAEDIRTGNYDQSWVEMRAKSLNLRPVDYLHQVSSGRREP